MFSYQPLLRVTPPAGAAIVYDLGALDRMTVAQPFYEPDFNQKVTLRRRLRNIHYGWRPRVAFAFVVEPGSASETTLVEISLAVNRAEHLLEISMDGGTLYREVVLAAWSRTRPEEKNVLAIYQVEFAGVDLISDDSLPPETRQGPPTIAGWA